METTLDCRHGILATIDSGVLRRWCIELTCTSQLRHEVEEILDSRGGRKQLQYLVKWKHFSREEATWEGALSELLKTEAARAAISRFNMPSSYGETTRESSPVSSPRPRKRSLDSSSRDSYPTEHSEWNQQIVRSIQPNERTAASPRIFNGGLGEPPAICPEEPADDKHLLEKEHRYWLVVRYCASTEHCMVVPLLAAGRFGGCGRRAGRIRWRPAPLKQGYEREVLKSCLQLVPSETVTGAREAKGAAWCVDDQEVEQAARAQAAAARNKRRRFLENGQTDEMADCSDNHLQPFPNYRKVRIDQSSVPRIP